MGHFPQVPIWIFEVAAVASAENLLRFFHELGPGVHGLIDHFIDFFFRAHVVSDHESVEARTA